MKVRYPGPRDVFAAGAIRIRRGETADVTPKQLAELDPRARARLVPVAPPRSQKPATAPAAKARTPKPKKES